MKQRLAPLVAWSAVVFAVWISLRLAVDARWQDTAILSLIGAAYTLAVVVMLAGTQAWSIRSLGILGTVLGDVGLYGRLAMDRLGLMGPLKPWELDLVRAFFIVGSVFLTIGLLRWLRERVEGPVNGLGLERDEQTGTQYPPQTVYERRSGTDRRAGWGKQSTTPE